jgi:hypothetical protein
MSWFAGKNVEDIPDDPNRLPNNTYKFRVTSAIHRPTQDNSKEGITFKYQIIQGAWSKFFPLTDWVQTPTGNTPGDEVERMLSALKMRLMAFGFDMDQIQEFGPDQIEKCVGREFFGTTHYSESNGRTNIRVTKFSPIDTYDGASDSEPDF